MNEVRSKTIYGVVSRQNFVFQNLFAEIEHMELARHFIVVHIRFGEICRFKTGNPRSQKVLIISN